MPDQLDTFTRAAWEHEWETGADDFSYDPAASPMLADSVALLRSVAPVDTGRFLEAGCGRAATAYVLAQEGWTVAGVDMTESALGGARRAFEQAGIAIDLRLGDVRALPFEDGSFDLLYAGGVVEHFRETEQALREFGRCLRPGGIAVVTVPALTMSWPYLALRGNVPAVPVAEPAAAFVQFKLLRGRLAKYGYERSFTRRRLRSMMRRAGFRTRVECFDTYLPLPQLPERLRPAARRLAKLNAFCPMWCAIGERR